MTQAAVRAPGRCGVRAGRGVTPSRLALAAVVAALLGAGGAAALHVAFRGGGLALPALNGQVVWNPGERPAPPLALRDRNGARVSLAALRDRPVILAFLGSRCDTCAAEARAVGRAVRLVPDGSKPQLVIVGSPGDTAVGARAAATRWQLPRAAHWLLGTRAQLARIWHDFGIPVVGGKPAHVVYLVDRSGFERTGYLFPFLPDVVARDLRTLAEEQ